MGVTRPPAERAALRAWVRLLQAHKTVLGCVREELSGEVTLPRFDLLSNLDREDGQTLAQLSRRMLVTAGNLTGLVDRAERDGLVERRADPDDRRATRVHLTRLGKKLYAEAAARHSRRIAGRFEALEPAELEELARLLDKLLGKEPAR